MSDRSSTALAEAPRQAQAVVRRQPNPGNDLRTLLESRRESIAAVLPKHLDADRLLKIAVVAVTRNELLLKCTPMTILQSVMTAAQLGLDVGGALGSAYLVPFKKSKKDERGQWQSSYECQLIIGYRGLIDLARRSGQIDSIEARVVYTNDEFDAEYTVDGVKLRHKPALDKEPGPFRLVYAVAKLKDGGRQFEMMSKAQVDGIRARSKSGTNVPWVTDYDEMSRKTVVKRLAKYLPIAVELADAITTDNKNDFGTDTLDGITTELPIGSASLNKRLAVEQGRPIQPAAEDAHEPYVEPADVVDEQPDPTADELHEAGIADADAPAVEEDARPVAPRVISADEFPQIMAGIAQDRGVSPSELTALLGKVKLNNAIAKQAVRTAVVEAFAAGKLGDDGKIAE